MTHQRWLALDETAPENEQAAVITEMTIKKRYRHPDGYVYIDVDIRKYPGPPRQRCVTAIPTPNETPTAASTTPTVK